MAASLKMLQCLMSYTTNDRLSLVMRQNLPGTFCHHTHKGDIKRLGKIALSLLTCHRRCPQFLPVMVVFVRNLKKERLEPIRKSDVTLISA